MNRTNQRQIFICLCLLFCIPSFGQSAREILDRYLDTVSQGDIAKWSKIKSVYATSISYFDAATFESKVDFLHSNPPSYKKLYKIWPDRQKEELYRDSSYTGVPSKFYFLRDKHVILLNNGMPPRETPVKKSILFEFYPVRVQEYIKESREMTVTGLKRIPGKTTDYFEVVISTRKDSHHLFFNSESYLLEAIFFASMAYPITGSGKSMLSSCIG